MRFGFQKPTASRRCAALPPLFYFIIYPDYPITFHKTFKIRTNAINVSKRKAFFSVPLAVAADLNALKPN